MSAKHNLNSLHIAAAVLIVLVFPMLARAEQQMSSQLSDRQKVLHVLNRLAFGPRPGDVERVEKMGIEAYIRQQLHPEAIPDAEVDKALAPLDTLTMASPQLMSEYFQGIRRFIDSQKGADDPEMKTRYGFDSAKSMPADSQPAKRTPPTLQDLAQRDSLRCVGELQQAKLIRAIESERQLNEVLVDFWTNHFNIDLRKGECRPLKGADDRDVIRPHVLGRFRDLLGASAHSPAMLFYLDNSQNAVTRERSATEKRMIEQYLQRRFGSAAKGLISDKEGPNENYGREIMELHTLGVDGGYTQKDVQEVARCFTGWGLGGVTGEFQFRDIRHDNGEKIVLGHVIPAGGGIKDGEMVLDILASHPSTARFISRKLCQRFVADEPPTQLVDRVAKVFTATDGDLRQVVEAIVSSPEFFSPQAYRAKIKSPFEYAVSAVRATGGALVEFPQPYGKARGAIEGAATIGYGNDRLSAAKRKSLNWSVFEMGEPLFAFTAPTGYPEVSSRWVSAGALIDRLNFALALTEQNVSDVHFDPAGLLKGVDTDHPQAVLDRLSDELLHGEMTDTTRQTLMKRALPQEGADGTVHVPKLVALILGSPEFQRR